MIGKKKKKKKKKKNTGIILNHRKSILQVICLQIIEKFIMTSIIVILLLLKGIDLHTHHSIKIISLINTIYVNSGDISMVMAMKTILPISNADFL